MMIHFGKHQGETIEEIPSNYLKWMVMNLVEDDIVEAAEDELTFRDQFNTHWYD